MTKKANRSSSITTDTARAQVIANAEAALNKTVREWGEETAATFKREGIASFTLADAKVWSAARRAEGVPDGTARARLMHFRNALEDAGIKVVRSKQGGAKNGQKGGKAKAAKADKADKAGSKAGSKASADKGTRGPSKAASAADTLNYLRGLVAKHTASNENKRDAAKLLHGLEMFFGIK